jgi:hypothetical protein
VSTFIIVVVVPPPTAIKAQTKTSHHTILLAGPLNRFISLVGIDCIDCHWFCLL